MQPKILLYFVQKKSLHNFPKNNHLPAHRLGTPKKWVQKVAFQKMCRNTVMEIDLLGPFAEKGPEQKIIWTVENIQWNIWKLPLLRRPTFAVQGLWLRSNSYTRTLDVYEVTLTGGHLMK